MNTNILVKTKIERIDFEKIDYKTDKSYEITRYLPVVEVINLALSKTDKYVFGDIYFDGQNYLMINFDGLFTTFSYVCFSNVKHVKSKARTNSVISKNDFEFVGNYFKMRKEDRVSLIEKVITEQESKAYYVNKVMKELEEEYKRIAELDFFLKGGNLKQYINSIVRYYESVYDGVYDELTMKGIDIDNIEIDFCVNLTEYDEDYTRKDLESDFYIPVNGVYIENGKPSIYAFINELGEVMLMNEDSVETYESFLYNLMNDNREGYFNKILNFNFSQIKHPEIDALDFVYYLDELKEMNQSHFA